MTDDSVPNDRPDPALDSDLLHGGSDENEPPEKRQPDESTDDLLQRGSNENEPPNEPPIERKDGQVYGG
jgi:hypothetical protein